MLFDELDVNRAASSHQSHDVRSAIPIQAEEALEPMKWYLEGLRRLVGSPSNVDQTLAITQQFKSKSGD
jgi:hypothetical protein